MVSSEADEARASPDIFRTMRRRSPTAASVADDDLGERVTEADPRSLAMVCFSSFT